jgi:hypothetical protein
MLELERGPSVFCEKKAANTEGVLAALLLI